MNFAESLKTVLKNKSQNILIDFWNYDFKIILLDLTRDVSQLVKSGRSSLHHLRRKGVKLSIKEGVQSGADILLIIKFLPRRIKDAFAHFRDDFLEELEKQTDPKQKTVFGLKVIGALTSFALGAVYNIRKGKTEFAFAGMGRANALTKLVMAELVFKTTQYFVYRFLLELEKELTDSEDLKNIRYFKELLSSEPLVVNQEELVESARASDRAIEIVEDLKTFIMTGKRTTIKSSP